MAYDVWSPDNIKRFQAGMGLKSDGVVGPKTQAAMGTQKGANWLLGDYNRGLAGSQVVPTSTYAGLDNWGTGMGTPMTQSNPAMPEFSTAGLSKMKIDDGSYTNMYGNTVDNGTNSFFNADNMKTGAQALQALGGLANAYTGYKAYGLAKDQFNFEKALANANYVNAARAYNTDLTNASNVGLALGGGAMTPEQIAAARAYTQSRTVSENAIG